MAERDRRELSGLEVREEPRGLFRRALGRVAEGAASVAGAAVVSDERLDLAEAYLEDRRVLRKELDLLAYSALDYVGGNEQDLRAVARRRLVQQARVAWQQDPQLGAAIELMNNFALGRGVPRPKAADPKVQDEIDAAWEDEDNQLVLTSFAAQMALSTDLGLQSNIYFLLFTGDDGRVKLSILEHDSVETVVRDEDNRRRILYYVAREKRIKWNYETDSPQVVISRNDAVDRPATYYAHWQNKVPEGQEKAPEGKLGDGLVYHVAINKTTEMAFGHPKMHRVLRWANAFNSLMEARVDAAKAAAAFIMKRKVKGTPSQVAKLAQQMLSKRGELGRARDPDDPGDVQLAPLSSGILNENEGVEHESFRLDSGAQGANVDSQMLRSQISAATSFPQHYLGDVGSANLATATSMELPVLKAVEAYQEVLEGVYRWFCDRVIAEATRAGRITEKLSAEEIAARKKEEEAEKPPSADQPTPPTPQAPPEPGTQPQTMQEASSSGGASALGMTALGAQDPEAGEEDVGAQIKDDEEHLRDMSYEFSLPSPLRRMMDQLITSISTVARTFDPNGTNLELSRILLNVALGEGLELAEPGAIVEKVLPPGYKDPALEALEAQQKAQAAGQQPGGPQQPPPPDGGDQQPQDPAQNPYSVSQGSTPEQNPYGVQEAALRSGGVILDGNGAPAFRTREEALSELEESMSRRLSIDAQRRLRERAAQQGRTFDAAATDLRGLAG